VALGLLLLSQATPALAVLPSSVLQVSTETSNEVVTYAIADADGTLTERGRASAGQDPVDFVYHPNGVWAYGLNNWSRDLSMYTVDATTHVLTEVGRLGGSIDPHSVGVHPNGRTLYATHHGFAKELVGVAYNAIWWYTIDVLTGVPAFAGAIDTGGTNPAEFAIHPSGAFLVLANRFSATLSVFQIDPSTGALTLLALVPAGDGPQSLTFGPAGQYLYVAHYDARDVGVYQFNSATGALTEVGKASTMGFPSSVRVAPSGAHLYVASEIIDESVETFAIDAATGLLVWVGRVSTGGKGSHAIAVDHFGRYLYVGSHYDPDGYHGGRVAGYAIDAATGLLTPLGLETIPGGFPTAVITSNPVADQARQDLLARAAADSRFGAPLFGTFGVDLLWQPGYELRWLGFQFAGDRLVVVFQATSTVDPSQRWLNFVDPDTGTETGWVPAL
jgi:6-phosphogluconolactonase (cycloisomerase 2 family)